jgi:hypothetical protein
MRLINRNLTVNYAFVLMALVLAPTGSTVGSTPPASDRGAWQHYTPEQKQLAIAGFADCYRSASSNKNAFAKGDTVSTVRLVDETSKDDGPSFPSLILQALKKAPVVKPDPHAEHWNGPTGFHSGLWWRGIDNSDREAYVQGAYWYTQVSGASAVVIGTMSVQATVQKLDSWYVITDDNWENPLSNARVDVPVISALQQIGVLRIKRATAKTVVPARRGWKKGTRS